MSAQACDEYFRLQTKCIETKVPEAERAAQRQDLEADRKIFDSIGAAAPQSCANHLRDAIQEDPYRVETDVIYRLDKGTIVHLDHQQKTYTEMTIAEAKVQADRKAAGMNPMQQQMVNRMAGGTPIVTKLGAGETIARYPTERYSIRAGMMQVESWVTPSLELPSGYYDMVIANVGSQMGGAGQLLKAMKTGEIKGYLLKSSGTSPMMQGASVTNIATSVEKGTIPPSMFEPPSGYRKVPAN